MTTDITKLNEQRAQLVSSLSNVAQSMRVAASMAESFANLVKDADFTNISDDGDIKTKRKRKSEDADEKPAKRARKPKDPNAPKRPPSSYILFQNDVRRELKKLNPDISNTELLALIARKWAALGQDDKAMYHKASEDAKVQYSEEKAAYNARSPEEVAAANAATEAAIAAKKDRKRGPRAKPVPISAPPAPKPAPAATSPSDEMSEIVSDSDGSDDDKPAPSSIAKPSVAKITAQKGNTDSSEESESGGDDDDDEEPAPPPPPIKEKPKAKPAPLPQPPKSTKKKTGK